MSELTDTDIAKVRAVKVKNGKAALAAVVEWLRGRDAATWSDPFLGEFQRGYDTAVEEVRIALAQGDQESGSKP